MGSLPNQLHRRTESGRNGGSPAFDAREKVVFVHTLAVKAAPSGAGIGVVTTLRPLERARPGSRVIHVLPGNARQHQAKAPGPFPERPDRRVRPRFLPPYAPHLNPTGRLWGVMHRHARRNRFHADLRQFTGAVLHFFDGTLPREWEAIAESVTDSFRVITHDGYRMAACAGCGHAAAGGPGRKVRSGSVQRVYLARQGDEPHPQHILGLLRQMTRRLGTCFRDPFNFLSQTAVRKFKNAMMAAR